MVTIPLGYLRFCGWMLLIGGTAGAIGQVIHVGDVPESLEDIPHFLAVAVNNHVLLAYASTFILMGLPGLFLRQAAGLKLWGWISLPLLFIGLMFEIFHGPVQIIAYPILFGDIHSVEALKIVSDKVMNPDPSAYPLMLLIFIPIVPCILLGIFLLALASYKARILSRGPAVFSFFVLAVLISGFFIHNSLFDHIFALVHLMFVWFGVDLAFEQKKPSLSLPS